MALVDKVLEACQGRLSDSVLRRSPESLHLGAPAWNLLFAEERRGTRMTVDSESKGAYCGKSVERAMMLEQRSSSSSMIWVSV